MIIPYRYEVQSQGKMEGLATLAYILLGRWNGPGEAINVVWIFETRVTVLRACSQPSRIPNKKC